VSYFSLLSPRSFNILHRASRFTIHDYHQISTVCNPQSLLTSGIESSKMETATHLIRRSFEATIGNEDGEPSKMPAWGFLLLGTTFLIFLGIWFTARLLDS
jgi:hypothetical protein